MVTASPLVPTPCRVRRVSKETADVVTVELDPPGDGAWSGCRPGQFAMLYVFGVGEAAISASDDPARSGVLVHTVHAVGPVSTAIAGLRRGDTIGVRGPYGSPWPVEEARGKDVVVVAGGIGLAPLRPVLREIAARRAEFGRVVLLYGARGPDDVLFRRELARWRDDRIDVEVTVDHATRTWPGHVGVVTTLLPGAAFDPDDTVAFVCGPEIMMRFTATALRQRGVPSDRVYVSLERNMKCAVALCGRCQLGPTFVCKDGPVFPWARVEPLLAIREL
jgi:NAD(P)H-flavin reductase